MTPPASLAPPPASPPETTGPRRTFAVLLQRSRKLKPTWTTVHLAHAALHAGHRIWFFHPTDVELTSRSRLVARVGEIPGPPPDREDIAERLLRGRLARRYAELRRADLVLLRLNPLTPDALATALLIREAGVPVVNDPAGVALARSKAWLASLADVPRPRTTVTRSAATARLFAAELEGPAIVKPATGSGGRGVALVGRHDRRGLERALRLAREAGDGTLVVQEYLAEAEAGEKRLVWMDGQLLGAYLRTRSGGEFRHNLSRGGQASATEITAADRAIAHALRPHLDRNGIRIAGLDVIGDRVVEVNCQNPGGVHHATELEPPESAAAEGTIAARMVRLLADLPARSRPPTSLPPHPRKDDGSTQLP